MPLTQTGKRLTCEDIVARASDCEARPCTNCKGEGFLFTDLLCPVCSGSGAVMVRKIKRPPIVSNRVLLWLSAFCLALAAALVWVMFR